jgi:hypothetical protein
MELENCLITDRQISFDKNAPEIEGDFDKQSTYPIWWVFFDPLAIASIDYERTTDEYKER